MHPSSLALPALCTCIRSVVLSWAQFEALLGVIRSFLHCNTDTCPCNKNTCPCNKNTHSTWPTCCGQRQSSGLPFPPLTRHPTLLPPRKCCPASTDRCASERQLACTHFVLRTRPVTVASACMGRHKQMSECESARMPDCQIAGVCRMRHRATV